MSANINLSNIGLTLGGMLDLGLDAIALVLRDGVRADLGLSNVKADVSLGPIRADANIGLNDIRLRELATVRAEVSIQELPLIRSDSKLDLGLDDIRIQQLPPIEVALRPTRVHLPLSYSFGIELFGFRLFKLSLCGEGMVITENYQPRETERC